MSAPVAALVYADRAYPDRLIRLVLEPLRRQGVALAGALQLAPCDVPERHPCDMRLENLASGAVTAIAGHRGRQARGCRLDVGLLTGLAEAVERSLQAGAPSLLVINKFGKIEADGGGLRQAIARAVARDIPALVGVPARNLDRWRGFAGSLAVELPAEAAAIESWLAAHGLCGAAGAVARRVVHAGLR